MITYQVVKHKYEESWRISFRKEGKKPSYFLACVFYDKELANNVCEIFNNLQPVIEEDYEDIPF